AKLDKLPDLVNTVGALGTTLRKGAELTYSAELPKSDSHVHRAAGESRSTVGGIDRDAIKQVIDRRGFQVVYQPILDLDTGEVTGVEALSRFRDGRPPTRWFE